MSQSNSKVSPPRNEPVLDYKPGAPETILLKNTVASMMATTHDIPLVLNGKEVRTGKTEEISPPHNHQHKLGKFHKAGPEEIRAAVQGSLAAWKEWSHTSRASREAIFLKAGELLATKYRPILNAATMIGQSKTCHQAEIDAACELVDFFRFNVAFQSQLQSIQPESPAGMRNQLEYRPLEGFVFAVTPFNFTSIAGNLPTAPALMGNVCVWKPASTSILSGYYIVKLLEEAGLPPGVIQFLPGSGAQIGEAVLSDPHLAGIHFTGSTGVFNQMWKTVGDRAGTYRNYPRVVGETGGKDFIVAHPSCDAEALKVAILRGAFEYQGQKCSAASRAYVPKSIWPKLKEALASEVASIAMGDVSDFRNFMSAVIDKNSFENIKGYIDGAKKASGVSIVAGGKCDDSVGYFVQPTVIEVQDPKYRTMCEEIFGPVITIYPYEDAKWEETLKLVDETSPYALTGAIFASERPVIDHALKVLRHSAGNIYINNKPTGAVVGQQPFGGARASGTNDKAGSVLNLIRWTNARTISETFSPPTSYRYPFMDEK